MSRKNVALVLFSLVLSCATGSAQNQTATNPSRKPLPKGVKAVYDKTTDQTTVVSSVLRVREVPGKLEARSPEGTLRLPAEQLEVLAHFNFPGKNFARPTSIVLSFLSIAQDEFKYSSDDEVTVTADAVRFDFGNVRIADRRVDTNMGSPYYRETLEVSIRIDNFLSITNAAEVKVRLGKVEFDLSTGQIKSLRALGSVAGS